MHQWNILQVKPIGNHTVFSCYTSKTTIALWQLSSRQFGRWWDAHCSLSKVQELFFYLKIGIGLCPWGLETRKFPRIVKVCFECLSVVSMCIFFSFLMNLANSKLSLKDTGIPDRLDCCWNSLSYNVQLPASSFCGLFHLSKHYPTSDIVVLTLAVVDVTSYTRQHLLWPQIILE